MEKYLIIGASGNVGSEIVKILKDQKKEIITTTSKKTNSHKESVYANLLTKEGFEQAFEGVTRAFFMSPAGYADQYQILSPLIQEAKNRKIEKVVLMTAMGADASDESPMRKAELELIHSGISYNIIRPNWFMQNFNTFWVSTIKEQGKILLPVAESKTSFIDTNDIAAVAAKLLTNDDFSNKDFVLTGPQSLSHDEVASIISEVTGKKITFNDINPDILKENLLKAGLPKDYTDFLLTILTYVKAGYNAPVTDNVKLILGREPKNFLQYAKAHITSWT